jgi:cysteinyl-tRNA synthetase
MRLFSFLLICSTLCACQDESIDYQKPSDVDFQDEMRDFVIEISEYAKAQKSGFSVIPQNGIELVTTNAEESGQAHNEYLEAIDGHGQEDLFFGYDKDDQKTSSSDSEYLMSFLKLSQSLGNTILVTDYCNTPVKMDESYTINQSHDFVSYAAPDRELNIIADYPVNLHNENDQHVSSLSQVQNFLYLINPDKFTDKESFIKEITATNYDLLIMDLFINDGISFTAADVERLHVKQNGGSRMVICYMSIGEAEDYRYYWKREWNNFKPSWVAVENPDWPGNFKVEFWNQEWKNIIYGQKNSYLDKILQADFDGVYLDIIDAFEFFDNL